MDVNAMVDGGEWWLILDYAQIILWGYVLSYQYQVLKKNKNGPTPAKRRTTFRDIPHSRRIACSKIYTHAVVA